MANEQDESRLDSNAMDEEDRNVRSCCAGSPHSGGGFYEIRVRGHLDSKWSDWLEGLEAKLLDNGEMILSGTIVDQAALMGVLNKLNRLNLTLLSVSQVNQPE
jgi:hypothetical protein